MCGNSRSLSSVAQGSGKEQVKCVDSTTQVVVASIASIVASALASSGLWAYFQRKNASKTAEDVTKAAIERLLMGMAYERIMELGLAYINRGWLSQSEYEEYQKYYCAPYLQLGGNGVAQNIINKVSKLNISADNHYALAFMSNPNPEQEPTNA